MITLYNYAMSPYGWKVPFGVGGEGAHLYLDPEARFLFYFTSW